MFSIDDVVKSLVVTREQFATVFLNAQYNILIPLENRQEFEAVTRASSDKEAFREALKFAKTVAGLYNELVNLIIKRRYDQGKLFLKNIKDGKTGAELQAIVSEKKGYIDGETLAFGTIKAQDWTGKVIVNGKPRGSGVLIGRKRFLTAWHVLREMFDYNTAPNPGESSFVPKKDGSSISVMFDDFQPKRGIPKKTPKVVQVAAVWLEVYSANHDDEFGSLPSPLTKLRGFWDYAIIHLAEALGDEREYARLEKRAVVPGEQENIFLFQYPEGYYQRTAIDEITALKTPDEAIPDIRFLHHSNADHGSSGGPCFDKEFDLFGIHQGTWPEKINGRITNRGVPIRNIIMDIDDKGKHQTQRPALLGTKPEEYLVWYTDKKTYNPIIGLDDFQFMILDELTEQQGRLLSIQGTTGAGKTFCILTLFSLLNDTDNIKLLLPGETISKMEVVELAKYICSAAGVQKISFEDSASYNSTKAAWLKDEVAYKVIEALESKRDKRVVWLCITNLNIYDVKRTDTADFLLLLYEALLLRPWLKIVIDGLRLDVPGSLIPVFRSYTVTPKTQQDIENYISRFMTELKIKGDPQMNAAFASLLFMQYQQQLTSNPANALKFLSEQCKLFLSNFLTEIRNQ